MHFHIIQFFTVRFRAEVANNEAGCAFQPAADMMQLTWDDDLRKTARELLNKKSKIHSY